MAAAKKRARRKRKPLALKPEAAELSPKELNRITAAARAVRAAELAAAASPLTPPNPWDISHSVVMRSAMKAQGVITQPFVVYEPPKGVLPAGKSAELIAMDAGFTNESAVAWAAQSVYNSAFFNGVAFLGYPYLAELTQRPEYRRVSEVLATEMTREWIEFTGTSTDKETKTVRIKQLTERLDELDVRAAFRRAVELDGFFGRAHLYVDTGDTDNAAELKTSIGNGDDKTTELKFKGRTGFLRAIKPVEPVWTYPASYDALNPLKDAWYNPQQWYVQGTQMHVTRLLTFVGREVPDLLKPGYAFGGLSMSQMAKPYIDNWLRTRQSVADLIWSFSTMVLKTNMSTLVQDGGDELFKRAALFANLRTNQGLMMVDKDSEDFLNVSAPLGSLDKLQAQSQEQMCSVTGTPVVKLLGVQPAGLNASSEGELTTWYEWVEAYQEKFFRPHLQTVVWLVMRDLWGEIDKDIVFEFVPLKSMSKKEQADVDKLEADIAVAYVGAGIIDPVEVRQKLASDRNSPYSGLDVEDVPESVEPEEGFDGDLGGAFGLGEGEGEQPGAEEPREQRLAARAAERLEKRDPDGRRGEEGGEGRGSRARGSRRRAPRELSEA